MNELSSYKRLFEETDVIKDFIDRTSNKAIKYVKSLILKYPDTKLRIDMSRFFVSIEKNIDNDTPEYVKTLHKLQTKIEKSSGGKFSNSYFHTRRGLDLSDFKTINDNSGVQPRYFVSYWLFVGDNSLKESTHEKTAVDYANKLSKKAIARFDKVLEENPQAKSFKFALHPYMNSLYQNYSPEAKKTISDSEIDDFRKADDLFFKLIRRHFIKKFKGQVELEFTTNTEDDEIDVNIDSSGYNKFYLILVKKPLKEGVEDYANKLFKKATTTFDKILEDNPTAQSFKLPISPYQVSFYKNFKTETPSWSDRSKEFSIKLMEYYKSKGFKVKINFDDENDYDVEIKTQTIKSGLYDFNPHYLYLTRQEL